MSDTIDRKVVEMRFDNQQFERNVKTSMSTIDDLKKNLDFRDTSRNLRTLSDEVNRFDMSGMGKAVETVQVKFSALEVMAVTALANITNSAVNAGTSLVKSLSVDQLTTGFAKYEEKTKSVQTILNATGKSMDEVDKSLNKLNWFTDETSYSFTDMLSNIGKFTSAGIDLDTSVTAMEGVANWAAVSGQGINEASRAMYNLAQAIGVGSVKLIDWRSIENANMGTKEFKETAIETAKALGTLNSSGTDLKGTTVNIKNFASTLSDEWFTSDVLLKTLQKYGSYSDEVFKVATEKGITCAQAMEQLGGSADDLGVKAFKAAQEAKTFTDAINAVKDAVASGWQNTYEIIFGNYKEATVIWTDLTNRLYEVFASGAEARNDMLKSWKSLGGRDNLIKAFQNAFDGLLSVINPIKEAFKDIFPELTAERLKDITQNLENFTEKLILSDTAAEKVRKVFKGLFAIAHIALQFFSAMFGGMGDILNSLKPAAEGIVDFSGDVGDWLATVDEAIGKNQTFVKFAKKISEVIIKVLNKVGEALGFLKDGVEKLTGLDLTSFTTFVDSFKKKMEPLNGVADGLKDVGKKIGDAFGKLKESIENLTGLDLTSFKTFVDSFKEKFKPLEGTGDTLKDIGQKLKDGASKIKDGIKSVTGIDLSSIDTFVSSVKEKFHPLEGIKDFFIKVWGVLKLVGNKLGEFFSKVGATVSKAFKDNGGLAGVVGLMNAGSFAALVAGVVGFLKSLKEITENVGSVVKGITDILTGVKDCLKAYQTELKAGTLIKIAAAIGILAVSLVLLSKIDPEKLLSSVIAMTALFGELFGSLAIFGKIEKSKDFKSMRKITTSMVLLSVAVLLLSDAMVKLGGMKWDEVAKGIIGISGATGVLIAAAKLLEKYTGKIIKVSFGLILFATALRIMVNSVSAIGKLSTEQIAKGLFGILSVLLAIAAFMELTKNGKMTAGEGIGLMAMALGLLMISKAIKTLGNMDAQNLVNGVFALTVILSELGAFLYLSDQNKQLGKTALAMLVIAAALVILASAIKKMGSLSLDQLGVGLLGLTGALVALILFFNNMPKDITKVSFGFLTLAIGLIFMAKAIMQLGSMSWEQLARGLIGLGGAIAILVIACREMNDYGKGVLALSGIVGALMGIAMALQIIGQMSLESVLTSLLALAGVLVIFGVAAKVLSEIMPDMLLLSLILVALSVGLAAIGAASIILGMGLSSLAAAGVSGVLVLLALAAAIVPLTLLTPGVLLVGAALVVFSVGVLVLSLALTALSGALALFNAAGPASMTNLLLLASTAAQISAFAVQLIVAGAALLIFGAGAVVAGVGALAAGAGIIVLANGLSMLSKVDLSNISGVSGIAADLLASSGMLLLATPGLTTGGAALAVFGAGALVTGSGLISISEGLDTFVAAISDVPSKVEDVCSSISNSIHNSAERSSEELKSASVAVISILKEAMDSAQTVIEGEKNRVLETVGSIISLSLDSINSNRDGFVNSGVNLVDGFIVGMQSKIEDAVNTASYMASRVLSATRVRLGIHSPSLEFENVGKYADLGLAKGLKKYSDVAANAATSVGETAIRPVFDLDGGVLSNSSEIQNGLRNIGNSDFGISPMIESNKTVTMKHEFGTLTVKGVNNKNEFVASADYAVEEVLAAMIRRQNRV